MNAPDGPGRDSRTSSEFEYISERREFVFADDWYDVSGEEHFWFEWRFRAFYEQLRSLGLPLDREANVLDIGCGPGLLSRQLERLTNWTVDGTDLNEEATKHYVKGRGRLMYYDIMERQESFLEHYDHIIVFDVLEHLDDPRPFVDASLEHLKGGGYLFINVPAVQRLYSRYDAAVGHYCRYDPSTLEPLIRRTGIEIRDVRYWGFGLVPLLFIRKHLVKLRRTDRDIIRCGFNPPGDLAHHLLRLMMRVETSLFDRPWVGSSLLMAVRKTL